MKYKVEGCIVPNDAEPQEPVIVEPFSKWYDAETHLDAAGMFVLDYPEVNCSDIWVVSEDYQMGMYPLENVKWKADYLCGLRW